jgi:hypothetical protein
VEAQARHTPRSANLRLLSRILGDIAELAGELFAASCHVEGTARMVLMPFCMSAKKKAKVKRFDGAGHLDPKYAAGLLARSKRPADDDAMPVTWSADPLAKQLGEACVKAMNSGEDELQNTFSSAVPEDRGGPFIITRGDVEFAEGTDESNPPETTREPFPKTSSRAR